MTDEEKKAIEQARSNITRGNDIESAMLILEKCALDGVRFTGGRLNIFKIAVRQILNFLEEYKDKGYLDVVREKVKANETVKKQSKEIEELSDKLTEKICKGVEEEILEEYRQTIISKDKEIEDHIENKELINQTLGLEKNANINKTLEKIIILNNFEDKIKAEIEELKNKNKGYDTAYNLGKTYSNKKWEDKIKAKIEELEKQDKEDRLSHNYLVIPVLQSLLEKE